jgi:hypothetical protein
MPTYLDVPVGASGILIEGANCYWSFEEMTAADQGWKLTTISETIWFPPSTRKIYLFIPVGLYVTHLFLAPAPL